MKIDFVSDVSCPWCAIGLKSLEEGIARLGDTVKVDLHFQPFELNPDMGPQGQDIGEHLMQKYGASAEQRAQSGEAIRARGAALGFTFRMDLRGRIYNTFDAHRLLYWAGVEHPDRQRALKLRLFEVYFTEQRNPSDHDELIAAVDSVGLDPTQAAEILASDRYAANVREAEHLWHGRGIHSVPAVVINDRYLVSGGQPADAFEQALRSIASELTEA